MVYQKRRKKTERKIEIERRERRRENKINEIKDETKRGRKRRKQLYSKCKK
jgi:hypothetical protein